VNDFRSRGGLRVILQAALLLLAVAIISNWIWQLLSPLLPSLVAFVLLGLVASLFIRRR
jgi:hypothetical protein